MGAGGPPAVAEGRRYHPAGAEGRRYHPVGAGPRLSRRYPPRQHRGGQLRHPGRQRGLSPSRQQKVSHAVTPLCFNTAVPSGPTTGVCSERYGRCHKLSCTLRRFPTIASSLPILLPILSISLLGFLKNRNTLCSSSAINAA